MTENVKESEEEDEIEKENEQKDLVSSLGEKILEYKNYLDAVPSKLISVEKSENDREEINKNYSKLRTPATQLLDSRFYGQLVNMNRERDKNFLREGTTRKERIRLLSRIMLRVTTPMLVLNQRRVLELSDQTFFGIKSFDNIKKNSINENNYEEPVFEVNVPEISQDVINNIKNRIISTYGDTEWKNMEEINSKLNNWEADIFSQLARESEIIIKKEDRTGKIIILKGNGEHVKGKVSSILFEPES